MATKQITPDPKPAAKKPRAKAAPKAQPTVAIAEAFNEGATISELAIEHKKSHSEIRTILGSHGIDFSADKNALDLKDKVKQASAATTERRAKNAADKAKVAEAKAAERTKRQDATAALREQVVTAYKQTGTVKDTAARFVNPTTGKPYSTTRIMRILTDAGVLTPTKRGDTSERDTRIVEQITSGMEIADVATEHGLSAARVRSIAKKQGLVLEGATRGSKLPEPGTPEWNEFANDVAALCEKWGSALGTMAHAIRRAGSAAGS